MNQEQMWEMFNQTILKAGVNGLIKIMILIVLFIFLILIIIFLKKQFKLFFKKNFKSNASRYPRKKTIFEENVFQKYPPRKQNRFQKNENTLDFNQTHQKHIKYMNLVGIATLFLGGAYFLFFFAWMFSDYLKNPKHFEMDKYALEYALPIFIVLAILFSLLKRISRS